MTEAERRERQDTVEIPVEAVLAAIELPSANDDGYVRSPRDREHGSCAGAFEVVGDGVIPADIGGQRRPLRAAA